MLPHSITSGVQFLRQALLSNLVAILLFEVQLSKLRKRMSAKTLMNDELNYLGRNQNARFCDSVAGQA